MLILNITAPRDFNLILSGDDHEGSALRSQRAWDAMIDFAFSEYEGVKNNFVVDHGDIAEARMIDHPYYRPEECEEPRPLMQIKNCVANRIELARAGRLITVLDGNHTDSLWRVGPFVEEVCERLQEYSAIPPLPAFGTWTAKVTWKDKKGRFMLKTFHTHGRKSINSTADDPKRRFANMELSLKRQLKFKAGDCVLMCKGHTHKLLVCAPEKELYLVDDGVGISQKYTHSPSNHPTGYIHPDHRWYVNTGSYFRLYRPGYVSYAERFDYDPMEIGWAVALVRDGYLVDVRKVPYVL